MNVDVTGIILSARPWQIMLMLATSFDAIHLKKRGSSTLRMAWQALFARPYLGFVHEQVVTHLRIGPGR